MPRAPRDALSNTIRTSEVSQINNAGGSGWKDTLKVGRGWCKVWLSDGDFDITIGSVFRIMGFPVTGNPVVPEQSRLPRLLNT